MKRILSLLLALVASTAVGADIRIRNPSGGAFTGQLNHPAIAGTETSLGTVTLGGSNVPSSLNRAKYICTQYGNMATITWQFDYASAGTSWGSYYFQIPVACALPYAFPTRGSGYQYGGAAQVSSGFNGAMIVSTCNAAYNNYVASGWDIECVWGASVSGFTASHGTLTYFTNSL